MVVILKPKLCVLVLVALPAVAATARADDLKKLLNEKFQIAEIFEAGSHAAEKCPGLRVIEDNIRATADEAGVTDDVIYTPEWRFWERRGQTNARIGYKKNPAGWCESMWHFLGPDHPPMIKHALLRRD
jgi:hypothetical protein